MKFKNLTGAKIRIRDDSVFPPVWRWLNENQTIELPRDYGFRLGLTPLKNNKEIKPAEYKIHYKTKVETKKKDDFILKLVKIKGIGRKTAKDLAEIYDYDLNALKKAIKNKEDIPVRDDIAEKIKNELK